MTRKIVLAVVVAAACGKDKGGGASAPSLGPADADAVNALVPAELKDKVQFEVTKISDKMGRKETTYTIVAPKGWKKGFMPGSLEPADADNLGSKTLGKTSLKVGDNCDGDCKPKDWAATVDKVYYAQFAGDKLGKVIKDDKQNTSRTMIVEIERSVATGEKAVQVITTWWSEGASRHYVCDVELGAPAVGLAAAFEKACAKVAVSGT